MPNISNDWATKPSKVGLHDIREKILNNLLITVSILSVAPLIASVYRVGTIGWQISMYFQIAGYLVLGTTTLLYKKIPYLHKAVILIFVCFVLGCANTLDMGLFGSGMLFLVFSIILATILVNVRTGGILIIAGLAVLILVAVGVNQDRIKFEFNIEAASTAYTSWISRILAFGLFSAVLIVSLGRLITYLADSSLVLEDRSLELEQKNIELSQEISTREKTEQALIKSEEKYRLLAEYANDVIWTVDLNLNMTYISPSVEHVRGYTVDEIMAQDIQEQLTPESYSQVKKVLSEELEIEKDKSSNPNRSRTLEIQTRCKDGTTKWSEIKVSFIRDAAGKATGIVGVGRDIGEKKDLLKQLIQAQKMEGIGVLAGGIAHDFNNLLTVINGYTDMLIKNVSPSDPEFQELEQIRTAGQQATSLTSQLLAFSRKQVLQPRILNLNDIIVETDKMLRRLIGEHIELKNIPCPDLRPINADPVQIQQIVMNLAVNARDAMPKGGMLTLETANVDFDDAYLANHRVAKHGRYVMMAVSDNGAGMDEETQARVFEPFFTTKTKGQGTGLGLSTVYGIVKQSGGFIWVYSEPGRGTTFKIYFPQLEDEIQEQSEEVQSQQRHQGTETVLVVEDDESVRVLTCRTLHNQGYHVLEAANGIDALQIATDYSGEIHVILTDVIMPQMSGKEMVAQIEALRPGIKTLYVSGYTNNVIVHHGILDRNISFLQKPFTGEDLAQKLREVINS
jgi:two-component system cell cycle sensor histidine kinase/response regulator CckA